ncbi:MAG: hypothetical protein DME43_03970 [Verrucomicrobia bacterium]|nr:MAG: hypothetical protein DME43_03970 [Verrucomicrobiota bacterium]
MLSPFRRWFGAIFFLVLASTGAPLLRAQNTLIPLTTRRGMVFDQAGKYLYITTSDGFVKRYNLATKKIDRSYNVGGFLNGVDIARDGSFLLVAQGVTTSTKGKFQKVNLPGGSIIDIPYILTDGEAGGWDVGIGSNGLALVTTQYAGSGFTPLRQIDLATDAVSVRTDVPGSFAPYVVQGTEIRRSADGTRMYFSEVSISSTPIFTYSAISDTFGPSSGPGGIRGCAVSRDGSLLATSTYPDTISLDTAPFLHLVHSFHGLGNGAAFDATRNILYTISASATQLIAYDTQRFAELFRLDLEESPGDFGRFIASADGRHLALQTESGVRVLDIPTVLPNPSPTPSPTPANPRGMVFDHSGKHLYITTAEGLVFPYNLATRVYGPPYNLGGSLNGVDIDWNDSYLLVGQRCTGAAEACLEKLDLKTGSVTTISFPFRTLFSSSGSWDVAISSNGLAIFTACNAVHQLDLSTNIVTRRRDAPFGLSYSVNISRSADATEFLLDDTYGDTGPLFTYNSASNTFGSAYYDNSYRLRGASTAVSRNGTLIGASTYYGTTLSSQPGSATIHTFDNIDSGIAFDPARDRFYGVDSSKRQIIGYDTKTFASVIQKNIGEAVNPTVTPFGEGTLVASPNGHYLALRTSTRTRIYSVGTVTATPTPAPTPTPSRLGSISTRALIQTDGNVLIGGFTLGGTDPKKIVARALGPSLAAYGVPGTLQDPILELRDQTGALVGTNDNWADSQGSEIQQAGFAPSDGREAAILKTVTPGTYTIIVRGKNNMTGVGLVQIVDLDPAVFSALSSISTRSFVGAGSNVAIAGLNIGGATKKVLVRGMGPVLAQYGIASPLQDPTLELHDNNGATLAANDNWEDTQQDAIVATGLAPDDDYREAAILANLVPGNYTTILRGKNGSTGIALVEVYSLP